MDERKRLGKICRRLAEVSPSLWKIRMNGFWCEYDGFIFEITTQKQPDTHIIDGAQTLGEGEHAETVVNMRVPMTRYDVALRIWDTETHTLLGSYEDTESAQLPQDLPKFDTQSPRLVALYLEVEREYGQESKRSMDERIEAAKGRLEKLIA